MLEHGVSDSALGKGGFLQVSGVQVSYDGRRAAGSRIVAVEIGGRPVDPDARYTVAVPNYVAQGGDGHTAFRTARVVVGAESGPDLAALVLRAIETRQTITPRIEGRIRMVAPRAAAPPPHDRRAHAIRERALSPGSWCIA